MAVRRIGYLYGAMTYSTPCNIERHVTRCSRNGGGDLRARRRGVEALGVAPEEAGGGLGASSEAAAREGVPERARVGAVVGGLVGKDDGVAGIEHGWLACTVHT